MCAAPDAGAPSPLRQPSTFSEECRNLGIQRGEGELKELGLPAGRRSRASIKLSECGRRLLQRYALFAGLLLPGSTSSVKRDAEQIVTQSVEDAVRFLKPSSMRYEAEKISPTQIVDS